MGLKRTCAFSLPLPSTGDVGLTGVQPTCSSRWCKRVERFPRQGISFSALKDVRVRQLISMFHVTDLRRLELEGSSQALLGLNCFCFAFPTTSPILATIHGLHSLAVQGHAPSGLLVADGLMSLLLSFPTCPLSPGLSQVAFSPHDCPLNKTFSSCKTDHTVLVFSENPKN